MVLNKEEKETLRALSQDTSIVICKPDKRNGVVVLDKKDYIKKMGTILKDKTKFQPRKGNANLENLKKFQRFLSRLKRKGALGESVYNEIRPTAAVTPTLCGLPKVHKNNIPLRPILCSISSFTYCTNAPHGCQNL